MRKRGEWKGKKEKGQEWNAVKLNNEHEKLRSGSSTHKHEYKVSENATESYTQTFKR